jgi:hypothetical protein
MVAQTQKLITMNHYKIWLQAKDFNIVAFYPYTSIVSTTILEQNHNYKTDEHDFIQAFADKIWKKAEALGCRWDNKIVVELSLDKSNHDTFRIDSNIFVGWYDGKISIGLGIWQPDSWTKESNIKF